MKNRICLWLFSLVAISCQTPPNDSTDLIINECVGFSEYIIDNQSQFDLSAELMSSVSLGGQTDSLQTIASRQPKKITHDSQFGAIPKPTDTFTKLVLYRLINGNKVAVYTQDPIINERWTKTKRNPTDPDFGCYGVTYTLQIANEDLH